uniref:Secreted protein n=1 Tax=Meloidogyne hapla TaxID=6305 RepID=A0A1I8BAZ4_MELHA
MRLTLIILFKIFVLIHAESLKQLFDQPRQVTIISSKTAEIRVISNIKNLAEIHVGANEKNFFVMGDILERIDNILLDIKRKTGFWFIFTSYVREFFGRTNLKKIFDALVMDLRKLKENLGKSPTIFEDNRVELKQLDAFGLNRLGKNGEGIKSRTLDDFRAIINPLVSDIKMQFIIGQTITIKEFVRIDKKLEEAILYLDLKSKQIINVKHINGILDLIERNVVEARQNLMGKYKEMKSNNLEGLPLRFRRGYLDQLLKSKNLEDFPLISISDDEMNVWRARAKEEGGRYAVRIKILLKFFEKINYAISLIEHGIESGMRSPFLSDSIKHFEQNYLYMKFAQVLLEFHYIINRLVSAKILDDDSFPDAGDMLYAWTIRSEVIVPYLERINGNTVMKIFRGNRGKILIQELLSQTLHVFWELNKRYKIREMMESMLGTFTHDVVLSKAMELPQV